MFKQPPDTTKILPSRSCSRCGSYGPFYASQHEQSWCVTCYKEAAKQQYARIGAGRNAARRAKHVQLLLDTPPEQRTRRQTLYLLRHTCPSNKFVCSFCWEYYTPTKFRITRANKNGRDFYCKACRYLIYRLQKYAMHNPVSVTSDA